MTAAAKAPQPSANGNLNSLIETSMYNGSEWYYTADDETGLADVLCEMPNVAFTVAMSIPVADAQQMVAEQEARTAALKARESSSDIGANDNG